MIDMLSQSTSLGLMPCSHCLSLDVVVVVVVSAPPLFARVM